ncbi:MAG: hypothetical protein HQL41_04275, partial [Alphaproteobacteria bacterium]|nr:hypothetical protein [Alphaproteobacteria bacterium]
MTTMRWQVRDGYEDGRGGVAVVVVPVLGDRAGRPLNVVIARTDDEEEPFLGPEGWQPVEFRWHSGATRCEGVDLLLPLGQRVTAQIEDYTLLRLRLPEFGLEGQVLWEGITPPPSGAGPAVDPSVGAASSFTASDVTPPPPPPPPSPPPQPPLPSPPELAPPVEPGNANEAGATLPRSESVRKTLAIVMGTLLLILGIGWLVFKQDPPPPP